MSDYNGWTNRETWLVNLWFGDYFTELQEEGTEITAEFIECFVDDQIGEAIEPSSFIADLIDTSQINWTELADHFVDTEEK